MPKVPNLYNLGVYIYAFGNNFTVSLYNFCCAIILSDLESKLPEIRYNSVASHTFLSLISSFEF